MKKEIFSGKAGISYLQILILIVSSFAFSYIVYQSTGILDLDNVNIKNNEQEVINNKLRSNNQESFIEIIINLLYSQLAKEILPRASAETLNCCPLDKTGSPCNDFLSSEYASKCATNNPLPTTCSEYPDCKQGCCYNAGQGICTPNSPKAKCTAEGGAWKDSSDCSVNKVQECKLGCCVVGGNSLFVTEDRCKLISGSFTVDFRAGITNEAECISLSIGQVKGACIFSGGGCKVLTNQECRSMTGKNIIVNSGSALLCTSQSLNTTCKPTNQTTCVEGKDEVYFIDSCGNPGNIYDSSKAGNQSYWEKFITKENSCGLNSGNGNINSQSCGNCYHVLGSKCKNYKNSTIKPSYGENICADLSCKQAPNLVDAFGKVISKKDRKNGESWCVYDGSIGVVGTLSTDVAGSRHFRYSCVEGEVKVEPCADFRNEICIQESQFDVNGTRVDFSTAACRINTWQSCISVNTEKASGTGSKKCDGVDCDSKQVIIDKFTKSLCTPKYPEGFDLSSEQGGKVADSFCGLASATCVVKYASSGFMGGCKCVENCGCEKAGFTQQMNDLCVSLGDCGGYVNINGKGTSDGYSVSGAPSISADMYKKYATPVEGLYAETGNITKLLEQFGMGSPSGSSGGGLGISGTTLGLGALGVGFAIGVAGYISMGAKLGQAVSLVASKGASVSGITGATSPTLGALANGAIIAGIAVLAGNMIAGMFKIQNPLVNALVSTAIAVAIVLILAPYFSCGPVCWAAIIVILIINFILQLFGGGGKCKPKIVTFTCKPWQPPTGGSDCEKCNSNQELKPCSKYRCESLGKACSFINEGTKDEMCITNKDDGQAPVISPLQSALSGNYTYTNVSQNGFKIKQTDGKCVEAFTPLVFGISTNEAAQCKYDLTSKPTYEALEQYFGGSNSLIYNHTMAFSLPSVDSIIYCLNDTNVSYQEVERAMESVKIYTKCQDMFGHANSADYLIDICLRAGKDKTAPAIMRAEPSNPSFSSFNSTSKEVSIFTSEPAECKYSKQDKNYGEMENSFQCDNDCNNAINGWECSATFGNLSKGENNFYIRCKDQPWNSGENESKRNENIQSYVYKIKSSESALKIESINPNGTFSFNIEPITITLEATTSGGAENGKSVCEYKLGDNAQYVMFFNTDATYHKQVFNQLSQGSWKIYVKCEDIAGNSAESSSSMNLEIDNNPPIVTRVYNSGGSLYIYTDENSECAYSTSDSNCGFIFENSTQMGGGITQEHSTSWTGLQQYYVKCRDVWKNTPSACSIKVKAYNSK